MKNVLLFLFLAAITTSFGQTINGFVFDARTNKPIKGAHVYTNTIEQGTTSNFRGKFRLKFPSEEIIDSIYVSHLGYEKKAFPYSKNKKEYLIYLETNSTQLSEVQLTNVKRNLNYRIRYNKLSSMKKGLYSFGSTLKDNKIYVVGGNMTHKEDYYKKLSQRGDIDLISFAEFIRLTRPNFNKDWYRGELQVYDLNSDMWEVSDTKFRKRAQHNLHIYNNQLYVLGGKRLSMGRKYEYLDDKIEVFDNEKNTLTVDDTNPHQAVNFASFTHNDKLIVMGGSVKEKKNGQKVYTNKVHLYDLTSGFWYEMPSMPMAKETNGVLVNNKVYLIGGFNKKPLTSIEAFDIISGKWTKEGELFEGFSKPAVAYNGDMIYGFENGKMITYNTKTKELNQYLIDLDLKGSKLYYANNKLYVLGGFRENSFATIPSAQLYAIDVNEFQTTKINKSKRL